MVHREDFILSHENFIPLMVSHDALILFPGMGHSVYSSTYWIYLARPPVVAGDPAQTSLDL